MKPIIICLVISLSLPSLAVDTPKYTILVGVGTGSEDTPDNAFSIGLLTNSEEYPEVVWGMDIAAEGLRIDKTGGDYRYTPQDEKHGVSYNLLGGQEFDVGISDKIQALVLLGIRSTVTECPEDSRYCVINAMQIPNQRANASSILAGCYCIRKKVGLLASAPLEKAHN